jgi:hypothetical protein
MIPLLLAGEEYVIANGEARFVTGFDFFKREALGNGTVSVEIFLANSIFGQVQAFLGNSVVRHLIISFDN